MTLWHGVRMSHDAEALLTAPQVGRLIGKSGRTVVRMAEAGHLPIAQKLPGPNGAYLFRPSDVDKLLERAAS